MSINNAKPPECPQCVSQAVIPILYGEPTGEALAASDRGELVLGGCLVRDGMPVWHCSDCGHNFGELKLDDNLVGEDIDSIIESMQKE